MIDLNFLPCKSKIVYLHNNNLTGTIPSQIAKMTRLQMLYLSNNTLLGDIPSELSTLQNLSKF